MKKKIILGLGDSFMHGEEAGGPNFSFLKHYAEAIDADHINLGIVGGGNLGITQKPLLYDLPIWDYEERIVFFMPTGLDRLDVISPTWRWDGEPTSAREFTTYTPTMDPWDGWPVEHREMERSLSRFWLPRMGAMNFIIGLRTIENYCMANECSLQIFPAFSDEYNKESFQKRMKVDPNNGLLNSIPFEHFLKIDGYTNFYDFVIQGLAGVKFPKSMDEYIETQRWPNKARKFIHNGGHPKARAHELLAQELAKLNK